MIFVATGVQLPFDRLVRAVDAWAGRAGRRDVLAQIGASGYRPAHIEARADVGAAEFRALVARAELVVAHAGMGTIITALELGTPILVMPRRAILGEHRNDHQLATARRYGARGVRVAEDEAALARMLDQFDAAEAIASAPPEVSGNLLRTLSDFIHASPARSPSRRFGLPTLVIPAEAQRRAGIVLGMRRPARRHPRVLSE